MNEKKKTLQFAGVAVILTILALLSAPRTYTPDAFLDQGEPFFPGFSDPTEATTLEVIDYDEVTGSARPFKVTFSNGKWTIPSHYDYPADGEDRLSKTAAGVIDIKKDDFRSDNVSDHEEFGVIDPLDETVASLTGRGKRVTIKGKNEKILADFIIGNQPEGRTGWRFVRVPDEKRVYEVRMDVDLSTKFSDWIESDLLKVDKADVVQATLKDYSINETTRSIEQRDVLVLDKNEDDDAWAADRMTADQEVDMTKMNELLSALDALSIVGVRPKPQGLSQNLQTSLTGMSVSNSDRLSLQSKGYFFTGDGRLVSNEGELQALTKDGVTYTLRFGEVIYGTGEAVSAGMKAPDSSDAGPGENRYLFITASFDENYFKEPVKPTNTDFQSKPDSLWTDDDRSNSELNDAYEEWKNNILDGNQLSQELNDRFAQWYYVISSLSFDQLHLTRSDLLKEKDKGGG